MFVSFIKERLFFVATITVTGISESALPEGIFSIPFDFDRISKDDLAAMMALTNNAFADAI